MLSTLKCKGGQISLDFCKIIEIIEAVRNEIMGRESTPEEVNFLNDPAFRFDLPLVFKEDGTVTFAPTEEFNNRQKLVDNFFLKRR